MVRVAVFLGLPLVFVEGMNTTLKTTEHTAPTSSVVGLVSAPAGYDELPGSCTGLEIEVWADGHWAWPGFGHYGDSLDDCAAVCDEHPECAGFYSATSDGHCSHWRQEGRSGSISADPHEGHMCYRKQSSVAGLVV